jgi:competence protein ComEC
MAINRARWSLANRIAETVGPGEAGPAVAMTTGYDAFLSEQQRADMRDAGLAHLLAIGGLHMGIVSGFAFFLTRLLIAAWPWLALRVNGKKVAAGVGLTTVAVYLLFSGAAPSAERAATTASVAFVAILLDRRAITFNALAWAAIIILVLRPESIVGASFQMSFSATMALVALAEAWPKRIHEIKAPWPILALQRGSAYVGAALAASLVAGAATGPFSIYHFNSTANYGVIANALEFPLSTFVTMPALALGAAFETVGLGKPFLFLADLGLQWTVAIGRFVSNLPYSVTVVPSPPTEALPISFLGVCFVCLVRGRLRWLGLPAAAAIFLWPRLPAPDVWVASDGSNLAVRGGVHAVVLRPQAKAFDIQLWSLRRGLALPADPAAAVEAAWDCDAAACKAKSNATVSVSGWWRKRPPPEARLSGLCAGAELVVVRAVLNRLPPACAASLVLDGADFARNGSLELWRRDGVWVGRWSAELSGERPWTHAPVLRDAR